MLDCSFVARLLAPVVTFVLKLVHEQHELTDGIENDIDFVLRELHAIAAATEKHSSVPVEGDARCILEEWRELAYEIEQCLDIFIHSHARKRQRTPLLGLEDDDGTLMHPTDLARSLKNLRQKLEEPEKRAKRYGLCSGAPSSTPESTPEPQEQNTRLLGKTVGMSGALQDILEMIKPPQDLKEEKLKVISIVGPGGVGKTLLARTVYNTNRPVDQRNAAKKGKSSTANLMNRDHLKKGKRKRKRKQNDRHGGPLPESHQHRESNNVHQVCAHFDLFVWTHAADMSSYKVLEDILKAVDKQVDTAILDRHGLIQRLESRLSGKRYLIVIDDMRNKQQWEHIKAAFPDKPHVRSRVIVTTRIQSISDACSSGNGYVYKMRTLDKSDSRTLFIKEASLNEDEKAIEQQSSGLISKCDGLPLALVSTAPFVRDNGGLDFCAQACLQLGSFLEKDKSLERMQWVLRSNYNGLDGSALKARLLYFCTFKREYEVRRNSLIRRWLAEGLLDRTPRLSSSLLIEEYNSLCTLIDRNIISPTGVSNNGKVKRCRPSGMLLEYILNKSMVENFAAFPQQEPQAQYIRRFSMHHGRYDFRDFGKSYPRTLVVSGEAGKDVLSFDNCELMRVLDLELCTDLENCHLEKICEDLLLLKYLSLRGTGTTKIPRNIEHLQWLQTLDLRKTGIEVIPKEVVLLPQLAHLLGRFQLLDGDYNELSKPTLKQFLSHESKLETLTGFVAGKNSGFPQLLNSIVNRGLRKLKIWFTSDVDDTNLSDLTEGIMQFIREGSNLIDGRSLSIGLQDYPDSSPFQTFMASLSTVKGSLSSLKLHGPSSPLGRVITICINLGSLDELCLSFTTTLRWDDIVLVGQCGILRYLKLVAVDIEGEAIIERQQFKALKRLSLVVQERVPHVSIHDGHDPENKALKRLESLHIICEQLDGLSGIEITHLTSLKEIGLHSGTTPATVRAWKDATRHHPNRPNIELVEDPRNA
ncbi:unnamed protein product [Urochloa decumbens]|uniref:Uncharacterized protein n=1 Tax=Urochloa decumbens TaxID=240449 RepID=A0ABC9EZW6_9POAL